MIWKWKRGGRKINSLDGGNGTMFNTIYNFIACFIKPNKPEMEKTSPGPGTNLPGLTFLAVLNG